MPKSGDSWSPGPTKWVRNGILKENVMQSTLFLCTNLEDKQRFVAKTVVTQDLVPRTQIEIERRMYKTCKPIDSPYFPRYLGFNIEKDCKQMGNLDVCNLFLEWVMRGSLTLYLRRQKYVVDEKTIAVFCRDILKGLAYLHDQGKVHGDIRCCNVLLGSHNLKLCDLGTGKVLDDGEVYLPPKKGQDVLRKRIYATGSEGFMAPEVNDEIAQGPEADIYSLGCTLVEMATGFPPQKIPRIYTSDEPTDTGAYTSSLHIQPDFSRECFDFLNICLAEHPRNRSSAEALLNHPWFTKFPLVYPIHSSN